VLGGFAMLGTTLVAVTYEGTQQRIHDNQRQLLLNQLNRMIPQQDLDNDLLSDVIEVSAPETFNVGTTFVHRARRQGQPVAAIFSPVVARGYAGPIQLLIAVRHDGRLAGVRVLAHNETPGLGDRLDEQRSDWIFSFKNLSLDNPLPEDWKLKRDGGAFDQFTGASVTPRGVIRAVYATLHYFRANREFLFIQPLQPLNIVI
jgi:electron transport complex protein RnfG